MKALNDYIKYLYGDEIEVVTRDRDIEETSSAFLAGHQVLRKKILVEISRLQRERFEITRGGISQQTNSARNLTATIIILKNLLNED